MTTAGRNVMARRHECNCGLILPERKLLFFSSIDSYGFGFDRSVIKWGNILCQGKNLSPTKSKATSLSFNWKQHISTSNYWQSFSEDKTKSGRHLTTTVSSEVWNGPQSYLSKHYSAQLLVSRHYLLNSTTPWAPKS